MLIVKTLGKKVINLPLTQAIDIEGVISESNEKKDIRESFKIYSMCKKSMT